ncbi:MAG: DNA-processing protein DprA [Burkholderiaceae bacterium]
MSRDELAAWLRLVETPTLGRAGARRLLAAFGSPERVLCADERALRTVVPPEAVAALLAPHPRRDALPDATWRWLAGAPAAGPERDVVVLGDPRYPPLLLETADPPLMLYTLGRVDLLRAPALAIVGSRTATPQGLETARVFAQQLSELGLTIVSGLALGVDAAAHEGGLAGVGRTVAFVGTGIDQVYPAENAALARRIAAEGLVASEYPLGMPPIAANFPRRNRLIAGTAQGTLVVEAALKSGSLITARMALESGREVFAIPGSIHSQQAYGCHRLIQQGAKLVGAVEDILQELRLPGQSAPRARMWRPPAAGEPAAGSDDGAPTPTATAAAIPGPLGDALGYDPVTFDALAARTGLPSERLAAELLSLELTGAVQRLPGGLFQRRGLA